MRAAIRRIVDAVTALPELSHDDRLYGIALLRQRKRRWGLTPFERHTLRLLDCLHRTPPDILADRILNATRALEREALQHVGSGPEEGDGLDACTDRAPDHRPRRDHD